MSQHQLDLIASTLTLSGGQIQGRALAINPGVTDAQLIDMGWRLLAVRGYSKWALGDIMGAIAERDGGDDFKTGGGKEHTGGNQETGRVYQWADASGIDPKDRREMMGVCAFYPPAQRNRDLSWEHYREAMWGAADNKPGALPRALALLDHAAKHSMSVTALRRHIRSTAMTEKPQPQQASLAGYGSVFEFRRYAARELGQVSTYTSERAALLLADIGEDTLKFIDALRIRAAQ